MYDKQLQWMPWGMTGVWIKIVFRFLQFVLGITIFGIYCADLVAAAEHKASPNPAWLLATVVGGFSAITAVLYLLPFFTSYVFFWWDWILVILYSGVIGVFGKAYIAHKRPSENANEFKLFGPDFNRQRSAAYIDCISGALWMVTAIMSTIIYLKHSRRSKGGEF